MDTFSDRVFARWRQQLLAGARGGVLEDGVGTGKNFPHYPPGVSITGIERIEDLGFMQMVKMIFAGPGRR